MFCEQKRTKYFGYPRSVSHHDPGKKDVLNDESQSKQIEVSECCRFYSTLSFGLSSPPDEMSHCTYLAAEAATTGQQCGCHRRQRPHTSKASMAPGGTETATPRRSRGCRRCRSRWWHGTMVTSLRGLTTYQPPISNSNVSPSRTKRDASSWFPLEAAAPPPLPSLGLLHPCRGRTRRRWWEGAIGARATAPPPALAPGQPLLSVWMTGTSSAGTSTLPDPRLAAACGPRRHRC